MLWHMYSLGCCLIITLHIDTFSYKEMLKIEYDNISDFKYMILISLGSAFGCILLVVLGRHIFHSS